MLSTPLQRATVTGLLLLATPLTTPAMAVPHREPAEAIELLMSEREYEVFASLPNDLLREIFVEKFWDAHDPDTTTSANEFRLEWAERQRRALDLYGDLRSARSLALLRFGSPEYVLGEPCPEQLQPLEIWVYERPAEEAKSALVFLVEAIDGVEQALPWEPETGRQQLLAKSEQERVSGNELRDLLSARCGQGAEIAAALANAASHGRPEGAVDDSWLEEFLPILERLRSVEPKTGSLDFHFGGSVRGATVVDGELRVNGIDDPSDADFELRLHGDVYRDGRRVEHFRYDLSPAAVTAEGSQAVGFRRHLPPGLYEIQVSLHAPNGDLWVHAGDVFVVPGAEGAGGDSEPPMLQLLPLPAELLTGRQRIEALASGAALRRVVFYLDGRRVMSKSRPPYSVEVDLGEGLRSHRIEAVAEGADSAVLVRTEQTVNAGPQRFATRIFEPYPGGRYAGEIPVRVETTVPPGGRVLKLDIYLDEQRVTTLYQPPFVVPHLALPEKTDRPAYIRAVTTLVDGETSEDGVLINTSGSTDVVHVDFVEIYAAVVDRKGRGVLDLAEDEFELYEDGQLQQIRRLETVRELPINTAVVLDTSTSMAEELEAAERAALRFLQNVIQTKDRAAVIAFNDRPWLQTALTNDHHRLADGLGNLTAEGDTALYDSVVFATHYLSGLRGKRALVILTDGEDSGSRYSLDTALDFAQRSGTAIYAIGWGLTGRQAAAQRVLHLLARGTGGEAFQVSGGGDLDRVYDRIEQQLRSQYLVGYQSTQSGAEGFRNIELRVKRPRLHVKTTPGYHP